MAGDGGTGPPGDTSSWSVPTGGLSCADCHNPHGSANYRNLKLDPNGDSTQTTVNVSASTDIVETAITPTSTQYKTANIRYKTSQMAAWCKECHATYHDTLGGPEPGSAWTRHPKDISINTGDINGHADYTNWSSGLSSRVPVLDTDGTVPSTDDAVSCVSCHKAHGSTHDSGLIWDDPATADLEDGSLMIKTCQQCHNK